MDWALAAARFAHFFSLMSLFGALAYASALSPLGLAPELAPNLRKTSAPLAALALASALVWAALVARAMLGGTLDLDGLFSVLAETSFGAVWLVRLALLAGLLALALFAGRRWRTLTVAAGLSLASLALVGHAVMQTGALGLLHRANHATHLLLTGGWLGALPLFLVSLRAYAQNSHRAEALSAMMRFSRVGHYAVAGIFLTGALDVALTTHALPWPPSTPYRLGLDSKILVFAAMTALALFNRYGLAPRMGRSAWAKHALAAGAAAEIALAAGAVALVSVFATLDPA
jgi:putative copper resistance protein D